MRPSSIFQVECDSCGTSIETETLEAKCPKCHIVMLLEFGTRHELTAAGELRELP